MTDRVTPGEVRWWSCGCCGPHPESRPGWCAAGCGSDYCSPGGWMDLGPWSAIAAIAHLQAVNGLWGWTPAAPVSVPSQEETR